MSAPVSIGLIGVGPMAALHRKAIAAIPELSIAWCASRAQDKAAAFAAAHGIPRGRVIDEALAAPGVDALWIVAPCEVMAELAIRGAATGLPLFLEKPVGLTPDETRAVRDAVAPPHMVGLNRRFYEVVRLGRDLVRQAGGARAVEVHMPEALWRVPATQSERTKQQWQYANSVHLIDLFRVFAGEPARIHAFNAVRGRDDRSYVGVVDFDSGARGVYNAQWYAPGGWRVAVYADGLQLVYQPIETLVVARQGEAPATVLPQGPDKELKAGLHGQAEAFARLVRGGALPDGAADLTDYLRSVELVAALTRV